ncbi:histidine kinase-like protein [Streptomyces sp. 2132.2]|uniref:ATP-binding protein n=1 Tax=Streptomyces sp. 2132.2 TaxID=2485161 RepID=UPI000F47B688|nr:ATP-binding protein [Streptomyces sp. 2132.2]ROR00394.1 histidine kinase-like protein [Streptomyces sp. 2132.2]
MDTLSIDAPAARADGAVAEAREAARGFLGALRPAVGPDAADGVVLVVSELVTNAVRHGGGTYALRLSARPGSIEVAVEDPSPHLPRKRVPDLRHGTGGFGWHMVNNLSLATAVTPTPEGGKTVRALLPR